MRNYYSTMHSGLLCIVDVITYNSNPNLYVMYPSKLMPLCPVALPSNPNAIDCVPKPLVLRTTGITGDVNNKNTHDLIKQL